MAGSERSQNQVRQRPPNSDSFAASPTPILSTWMGVRRMPALGERGSATRASSLL